MARIVYLTTIEWSSGMVTQLARLRFDGLGIEVDQHDLGTSLDELEIAMAGYRDGSWGCGWRFLR